MMFSSSDDEQIGEDETNHHHHKHETRKKKIKHQISFDVTPNSSLINIPTIQSDIFVIPDDDPIIEQVIEVVPVDPEESKHSFCLTVENDSTYKMSKMGETLFAASKLYIDSNDIYVTSESNISVHSQIDYTISPDDNGNEFTVLKGDKKMISIKSEKKKKMKIRFYDQQHAREKRLVMVDGEKEDEVSFVLEKKHKQDEKTKTLIRMFYKPDGMYIDSECQYEPGYIFGIAISAWLKK